MAGRAATCVVVLSLVSACCRKPPSETRAAAIEPSSAAPVAVAPAAKPSRCDAPTRAFPIGEEKSTDEGDPLPFAAEVGDGVATANGFAVGALAPKNGDAAAVVVTLGRDGSDGKITELGTAHGDTPPPKVASSEDGVVAALLEAGPSARRLRLARVEGGAVTWGPSFEQGRDESLAFDIAIGPSRGVVAWDDDASDPDRGVIRVATFQPKPLGAPSAVRTVTGKGTDAEMPRVVTRPGGYWLAWIARKPEENDTNEARGSGEESEYRWLEAVPLDDTAAPSAPPRRLTRVDGHVLTFDMETLPDGGAVLAYRDDDVPSGAAGGVVYRVVVHEGGVGEPSILAEDHVGPGAPTLLPGWLALADIADETRLAKVSPAGELIDKLDSEPVLGRGEPIASSGDTLLVAKPRGTAVNLVVTTCHPAPASSP